MNLKKCYVCSSRKTQKASRRQLGAALLALLALLVLLVLLPVTSVGIRVGRRGSMLARMLLHLLALLGLLTVRASGPPLLKRKKNQ